MKAVLAPVDNSCEIAYTQVLHWNDEKIKEGRNVWIRFLEKNGDVLATTDDP